MSPRQDDAHTRKLVICATAFQAGNPFADILYAEAERMGYEVWRRPLVDLVRFRPRSDRSLVVHLHWISHVLRPASRARAVAAALKYLALVTAVRASRARVVWTFHNDLAHEGQHTRLELIVQWWLAHVVTSRIIVLTEGARGLVESRFPRVGNKIRVVPHPTYDTAYGPPVARQEARSMLDLDPRARILIVFGRILPYKGVTDFLEVFRTLDAPSAQVLLVGECPDEDLRSELERAAANDPRVALHLERVPDEDVPLWLSAADWSVLPYKSGLNSGVLLLSITYRRPVIAASVGALPELVGEGCGLLYDPRDSSALRETLTEALSTSEGDTTMMEAAIDRLARTWSPSVVARILMDVYHEAAAPPRRRRLTRQPKNLPTPPGPD